MDEAQLAGVLNQCGTFACEDLLAAPAGGVWLPVGVSSRSHVDPFALRQGCEIRLCDRAAQAVAKAAETASADHVRGSFVRVCGLTRRVEVLWQPRSPRARCT